MKLINVSVAILIAIASSVSHAASVAFTSEEVETTLQKYFPVQIDTNQYKITLNKPHVLFKYQGNNFAVQLDTATRLSDGYTVQAKATLYGQLDYSPVKGELYLRKPALISLTTDRLPKKYNQTVKDAVSTVTRQFIPPIIVYRLNKDNVLENIILQTLKSFTIKDGKIHTELAWLPGEEPASRSK